MTQPIPVSSALPGSLPNPLGWLRLSAGSAINLSGLGAALFSLAAGSSVSALLFVAVILLGTVNKARALRTGGQARAHLLLKPEVTATVLMVAAALNMLAALLGYAAMHYDLAWLRPYVPHDFARDTTALVFAGSWGAGAVGDYLLKLNDRRRFAMHATTAPVAALWRNPLLWYGLCSLTSNYAAMQFAGAPGTPLQRWLGWASVAVMAAALLYAALHLLRHGPHEQAETMTRRVSRISAAAALLVALQLAAGMLQGGLNMQVSLVFLAELLFMAGYLVLAREIHSQSLIRRP